MFLFFLKEMSINFEHRFWLQILGDHLRFIKMTLAVKEVQLLQETERLIPILDFLLEQVRKNQNPLAEINQAVAAVKNLKATILQRQLVGTVDINLPPTVINHTLNELEEYERILLSGNAPNHILNSHYLWSSDAAGHAIAIIQTLDPTEKKLMKKLKKINKTFDGLFDKVIEYEGYFRSGLSDFPAISKLNDEVIAELTLFAELLTTIREERFNVKLLGSLNPLMADHMLREEAYCLKKIYEAQGRSVSLPYDPTAPRLEKK